MHRAARWPGPCGRLNYLSRWGLGGAAAAISIAWVVGWFCVPVVDTEIGAVIIERSALVVRTGGGARLWPWLDIPHRTYFSGHSFVEVQANPLPFREAVRPQWWFRTDTVRSGTLTWKFWWVPLWVPLGACAAASGWSWRRWWRYRGPGVCAECGYDLSGLRGASACPECGAAAEH